MSNLTRTDVDLGAVELFNPEFKDELLIFAGAGTVLAGTILARKLVADAIVAAADVGNTGDGTVTLTTTIAGDQVPLVGAYNLECIEAVADGGVFKLEDPSGAIVAGNLAMTPGAGGTSLFNAAGMTFTITDGAANFIVGDKFSLTVAANGKMIPYATDGVGGAQIPTAVINIDVEAAGAGDIVIRPIVAGQVRSDKLIIDADGDGSNVTDITIDKLRDVSIVALLVTDSSVLDN